jgi:hypothetical protein
MAKQLTFIEQAILQATGMKEYRCWGSKKFNQEVDCPNINASISRFVFPLSSATYLFFSGLMITVFWLLRPHLLQIQRKIAQKQLDIG